MVMKIRIEMKVFSQLPNVCTVTSENPALVNMAFNKM